MPMARPAKPVACLLMVLALAWTCRAARKPKNVFRAGAVLTETGGGHTEEMLEAKAGYELFTLRVNSLITGQGFNVTGRDNANLIFQFDFSSRDDGGDADRHQKELLKLLKGKNRAHFIFGSHPEFAATETATCNEAERINFHCCVGPDEIYQQGFKYVFGIQTSNTKYTELTLKKMALSNLENLAVIYRNDNLFTRTTCEAAVNMTKDTSRKSIRRLKVNLSSTYNITAIQESAQLRRGGDKKEVERRMLKKQFKAFAEEAKAKGVESVVACAFEDNGRLLVDAFTDLEYPLKAMFLTSGPTKPDWVAETNNSAYLLSAVQWHPELQEGLESKDKKSALPLKGNLFGNPGQYANVFEQVQKKTATYVAAGASAVGMVLYNAIVDALNNCDIGFSNGDVDELLFGPELNCTNDYEPLKGYELVRQRLKECDIPTFFGHVRFNDDQRNVAKESITTQALGDNDECMAFDAWERLGIEAVLPTNLANRELKMPACNPFMPVCQPGYQLPADTFDPCEPCEPGTFSEVRNAEHCDQCPEGTYNDMEGAVNCTMCPEHTRSDRGQKDITGCKCKIGFFHPSRGPGQACIPCPEGAMCEGKDAPIVPLEGFWADVTAAELSSVYECPLRSACQFNGTCEEGYMGRVCDDCQEGYFKGFNHCFTCVPNELLVAMLVVLVAVWYLLNDHISKSLPSVEIMLSWAQLANVIGDLDLRWPNSLEIVFAMANLMDFDVDIIEPTCLWNSWTYAENLFVQMALPFILGGVALISYMLAFMLSALLGSSNAGQSQVAQLLRVPRDRAGVEARWDGVVAAFLSSIEITYITIAKYCFDSFKCEDMHGVFVLAASPDIVCGSHEHNTVRAQGAVGILFYVIGFPAYVSWRLYSLHRKQAFSDPVALRRYGFLYRRYELAYSWTGMVVLLRRVFFVAVLVFVHNAAFQVAILAAIIIASLMLHVYTAPYVDTYLDWLFTVLMISLLIECFGGMMFYASNLPDMNRYILEIFVLAGLGVLVIVFVFMFIWELRQTVMVYWLRRLHYQAVLHKDIPFDDDDHGVGRWEMKKHQSEVSKELLHTFDPDFVYKALKDSDTEMFMRWDRLSDMLSDYVADRSETSYLSLTPVAHFWRKLVERFPELVDFLAMTDEITREKFKSFATKLYNDFYLKKKVERGPIYEMLNWRDRAPLAQWLAMAEEEDLQFFKELITDMYKSQYPKAAEEMERKIQAQGGHKISDPEDSAHNYSAFWRLCGVSRFTRVLTDKSQILEEISEMRGPLRHSAQNRLLTQGLVATAAAKFKAGPKWATGKAEVDGQPDGQECPSPLERQEVPDVERGGSGAGHGKGHPRKVNREIISCSFSSEESAPAAAANNGAWSTHGDMGLIEFGGAVHAFEDWDAISAPPNGGLQDPPSMPVGQGSTGGVEGTSGRVDAEETDAPQQLRLPPKAQERAGRPTNVNRTEQQQQRQRRHHSGNFSLTVFVEGA